MFLRGDLSARELVHWAWGQIGLGGSAAASDLAALEIVFDPDEQHLWSTGDFTAAVAEAATVFLQAQHP